MVPDLFDLLTRVLQGARGARSLLAFWSPVIDVSPLLGPLLAIASVLSLALLAGIAVSSLSVFLIALIALYTLLRDVFGISIELA